MEIKIANLLFIAIVFHAKIFFNNFAGRKRTWFKGSLLVKKYKSSSRILNKLIPLLSFILVNLVNGNY